MVQINQHSQRTRRRRKSEKYKKTMRSKKVKKVKRSEKRDIGSPEVVRKSAATRVFENNDTLGNIFTHANLKDISKLNQVKKRENFPANSDAAIHYKSLVKQKEEEIKMRQIIKPLIENLKNAETRDDTFQSLKFFKGFGFDDDEEYLDADNFYMALAFSNKYAMMEAVRGYDGQNNQLKAENAKLLKYARKDIRNDKNVVMAAVKNNGMALYYASKRLREEPGIVMTAIKQNGFALWFASDELRKNRKFRDVAREEMNGDAYEIKDIDSEERLSELPFVIHREEVLNGRPRPVDIPAATNP